MPTCSRHRLGAASAAARSAVVQMGADRDVLAHGMRANGCVIWKVRIMPARADAVRRRPVMSRPGEARCARHRACGSPTWREQRRLAGAVGADQRARSALGDVEADGLHRLQAAEGLGEVAQPAAAAQRTTAPPCTGVARPCAAEPAGRAAGTARSDDQHAP